LEGRLALTVMEGVLQQLPVGMVKGRKKGGAQGMEG
jgi:hypothetical protein